MPSVKNRLLPLAAIALATIASSAYSASHREAPLIALDPAADNTDVYAFVSYDRANLARPPADRRVTFIANVNPGQDPHAKSGNGTFDTWLPWKADGTGYKVFIKESEIHHPSHIWVILDEDPDSINDGAFAVQMPASATGSAKWIDTPANAHGNACGFAFVDGHSEIHRWVNGPSLYDIPNIAYKALPQGRYVPAPQAQDVRWVAERTTERTDGTALPY